MSDSVAVLQARTTSSRLPAKSLLPIGGYPLAVLSAKRAANTGRAVIIATSQESSDDALAKIVEEHGIPCFRGSLSNTLARFVGALADFDDDALVFRLTADNAFPDGLLLDFMEDYFHANQLDYLSCGGASSGLPYGVSAELMRVAHLREANARTTSEYDQEHVTPYIRRRFNAEYSKYQSLGRSHYRATIDTLDDYLSIEKVFAEESDPLQVSFLDLINRLTEQPNQPIIAAPAGKLVLGTAQLGMDYGIANVDGQPSVWEADRIVKKAISNGMPYIDTARAYGDSEKVLGKVLRGGWSERVKVLSKLSPLDDCPDDASHTTVESFVKASVYRSCTELQVSRLDTLILHRADHLQRWDGAVLQVLGGMMEEGIVGALGVSVQTPDELSLALASANVQLIQMPFNVLDWRFDNLISEIQRRRVEDNLIVHTRSPFLQGLLVSTDSKLWRLAGVASGDSLTSWLKQQASEFGFTNTLSFCLGYCVSQTWIDGVVVGVETAKQLEEVLVQHNSRLLSLEEVEQIKRNRPTVEESVLNPALWQKEERL